MKEMPLVDHLEELRKRAIRIFIILGVALIICYGVSDQIAEFLLAPLREALGGQGRIVYLGILDKVLAQFQVAFWSAIILSSPLWFWQIWLFVRPGLLEKEVKVIRPFLLVGVVLFWAGILFGEYVVFPLTFQALMEFGIQNVEAMMDLKDYLLLASKMLVLLGFLFQLPNVMVILGFMGLVTKYSLSQMRRYVYLGFSIFAAVITPPDVITMLGLWIPLMLLYEVGVIAVALIVHPYLHRQHGQ